MAVDARTAVVGAQFAGLGAAYIFQDTSPSGDWSDIGAGLAGVAAATWDPSGRHLYTAAEQDDAGQTG